MTGHSNQHESFPTDYLQFMDSALVTMCHLIFLIGQQTLNVL